MMIHSVKAVNAGQAKSDRSVILDESQVALFAQHHLNLKDMNETCRFLKEEYGRVRR